MKQENSVEQVNDEFVFFWRPQDKNGYLGQWYKSPFGEERDGEFYQFSTAEHYSQKLKKKKKNSKKKKIQKKKFKKKKIKKN